MNQLQLMTRPRTRGECVDAPRPCPWVSCRYHLYITVRGRTLRTQRGELEEMTDSCALDVADGGRHSVLEVSALMGIGPTRVRELEDRAMHKMRGAIDAFVR